MTLLAVRAGDVAVAERRLGRPDALLGLLLLALARLLRQVVDVVLRHQHLDAVHELLRGARLARQDDAFLGEVDLGVEFVDRHPVLEVAVEPVGLLDQQHAHSRMRLQPGDHLAEGGAAGLLGRLHVHIFLRHREALRRRVVLAAASIAPGSSSPPSPAPWRRRGHRAPPACAAGLGRTGAGSSWHVV